MATSTFNSTIQNSSQRGLAMVLAAVSAVILSPLYIRRKNDTRYYESTSSGGGGLVLPMLLAGLIIAIKTASVQKGAGASSSFVPSPDPSWVLRIGSSSWGLAGVLVMLMLVLGWRESVQEFFWR